MENPKAINVKYNEYSILKEKSKEAVDLKTLFKINKKEN